MECSLCILGIQFTEQQHQTHADLRSIQMCLHGVVPKAFSPSEKQGLLATFACYSAGPVLLRGAEPPSPSQAAPLARCWVLGGASTKISHQLQECPHPSVPAPGNRQLYPQPSSGKMTSVSCGASRNGIFGCLFGNEVVDLLFFAMLF